MIGVSEQHRLRHRIGKKSITILKKDGEPLANANVSVTQKKHDFLFGCAEFSSMAYANGELDSEKAKISKSVFDKFFQLFNFTTLPFYWETFEPNEMQIEENRLKRTAEWFKSNDCMVKGHPLCWHSIFPSGMSELTNKQMLSVLQKRIEHLVGEFTGIIDIWDVINEPVIMPAFTKNDNGLTKLCREIGRINMIRETFTAAGKANSCATLMTNDYFVINDLVKANIDSYEILIESCLEAGIGINAIGIQSHMYQGFWGLELTKEILERFGRFGLPLHFTECTIISGHLIPSELMDLNDYVVSNWPSTPDGEEKQAKEAALFYKALFEEHSVESITWWEFVDGNWLGAPSGFITKDNRVKPIYNEMYKLIKQDWWTGSNVYQTDDYGRIHISGFYGDYEISYKFKSGNLALQKGNANMEERVVLC